MKKAINISIIILGFICMSNSSCSKQSIENIRTAEYDNLFELSTEEQVILPKASKEIMISLNSINDSRCPKDIQCVWAGNATVELTIMAESGAKASAVLCLGDCKDKNGSARINLDSKNYLVTLSAVTTSETSAQTKSKASLIIKKL